MNLPASQPGTDAGGMAALAGVLSPDDMAVLQQAQAEAERQRIDDLDALGQLIAGRRKEAVDGRAASGIEKDWREDEEFYAGIDDANRHEFADSACKPTASGATARALRSRKGRSTVFPNITAPYVDAAAARIGDMLLPTDDRNFAIQPTPVPALLGGLPATPPADPVQQAAAQAAAAARQAETQIDDWLAQSQWHAEVRLVLDDCARLGSGVMKGPVPVKHKTRAWMEVDGQPQLVEDIGTAPGSRRIAPWNFYPDPACGEDIHDGSYTFECDELSEPRLLELKGLPGYIDSQIDAVIEEGPVLYTAAGRVDSGEGLGRVSHKGQWQVWYFHGLVKRADLEAAGCSCVEEGEGGGMEEEQGGQEGAPESVHAMLTLVNDRVIRAALNPLDSGEFPYDVLPWKRREGLCWGVGVAREIRTAQRIVTAATRNLMDNAGLASGPQIILRKGVKPADGVRQLAPLKFWIAGEDSEGKPVDDQFRVQVIPMLEGPLMSIIQMGMKMAEDTTGLPMLLQGQQGKAPDTVGGMTILNNNGSAVLRRIARMFDSRLTEPHIRRYYSWLLAYSDDMLAKGDAQVVARGSSALVERDLQSQEMVEILKMSLNPIFGWSPRRAAAEYLKSRRFDPEQFKMTPEDMAAMQQNAPPPPPPPPQIAAAQIRAQSDAQKTDKLVQRDLQIAQLRSQDAAADRQQEAQQHAVDNDVAYQTLQSNIDLALREFAVRQNLSLEEVKAKLADTTLRLNTQVALAHQGAQAAAAPQLLRPAMEPLGRAAAGRAFQE